MNDDSHRLTTLFYRNGHLLLLTIAILLVAGTSALMNLPRIEDPRIALRNPIIVTLLPGASAARVEALVTEKLEDRLEEIPEIKEIRSTSRSGISFIIVELRETIDDTNNEEVFSKIRDKLSDARRDLPASALQPVFDDQRGAVAYSLIAGLEWEPDGPAALGVLNRLSEDLADRLRTVNGTEFVHLFGEPEEEVGVTVYPARLAALGMSPEVVASRLSAADVKNPAGVLRTGERDLLLEVGGELDSVGRVASVPIGEDAAGSPVTVGDVADVERGWREPPGEIAYSDGRRTVFVAARVNKDVRVDVWARQARAIVADYAREFDGSGVIVATVFDQSGYTEARLGQLGGNLLAGSLVVMLVVLVGMGWRAALIVGSALPLSAGAALFGLAFFGQQIHQMTIFGLIIAIGLLIDNAIVITDEVHRRRAAGKDRPTAVSESVRHLFVPLLASTLTTILGFMPIFLLPGNIGDFIGPVAIAVVLALAASFAVSLTVIAALAGRFLRVGEHGPDAAWWWEGLHLPHLGRSYRRWLQASLRRPGMTVMAALVLPAAGFVLASTLDNQFFPPADRDQFEVEIWMPRDASIGRTADVARRAEDLILAREGVRKVDWLIGGSFPTVYYNAVRIQDNNPAYANGIVLAESAGAARRLVPELQAVLDEAFPEAQAIVMPFGQGPPVEAPVAFRLLGPGLGELDRLGEELRGVMHQVPGILHTRATVTGGEPKLWFRADEMAARRAGLQLADLAAQMQGSLEGRVGGSVLEDLEELPVRVRWAGAERGSLDAVAAMPFVTPSGREWVPGAALGEMSLEPELSSITRFNGQRVNNVFGYVGPDTLPIEKTRQVLDALEASGFQLPPGYRLEVAGDSEESAEAIALLVTYLPVLLVLMIATVVLSFRSFTLAGIIGAVAVMSVGLGMLSLWLSGYDIGFNPILGSAGLIGVAINGSIVVLAAIRANPAARRGDPEAVVEETTGATRHIVSTTLTTIGGFLPLLFFTGGEFWPPLAVVIAGGVGFSMLLSLWFTPAVYTLLFGRGRAA
ncbi:MAG: efflux RND transporter permease subunit [Gammaproteobacteria bacterium]